MLIMHLNKMLNKYLKNDNQAFGVYVSSSGYMGNNRNSGSCGSSASASAFASSSAKSVPVAAHSHRINYQYPLT